MNFVGEKYHHHSSLPQPGLQASWLTSPQIPLSLTFIFLFRVYLFVSAFWGPSPSLCCLGIASGQLFCTRLHTHSGRISITVLVLTHFFEVRILDNACCNLFQRSASWLLNHGASHLMVSSAMESFLDFYDHLKCKYKNSFNQPPCTPGGLTKQFMSRNSSCLTHDVWIWSKCPNSTQFISKK